MRADNKPVAESDKPMGQLKENLKKEFWHRVEKCGMTLQEFHDAKANDEQARYIIASNMKTFMDLQANT